MWHEPDHRIALLELLQTGKLKRRGAQVDAWQELLALGWARRTAREKELSLVPAVRADLERTLDGCWSEWRTILKDLLDRGLPPTAEGLRKLDGQRRAERVGVLPPRVNQRTAQAALAAHSKARMPTLAQSRIEASTVTTDYLIRLRGCDGMVLHRDGVTYDAARLEHIQGELVLSERAMLDGTVLTGTPEALLLLENIGAFVDLSPQPGWTLMHAPGWDTKGARRLLEMFPETPVLHFGDLDPDGFAIHLHLRGVRPDLIWVVPEWVADYVSTNGLPTNWPQTPDLATAPPLIKQLARAGLWIEQEAIVLDCRLWSWMRQAIHRRPLGEPGDAIAERVFPGLRA